MTAFIDVETYRTASGPFPDTILQDSSENLQSLTVAEILALNTSGIVGIDSLDDGLSFTVAQFQALDSSVALDPSDQVALADTGANIGAADPSFLSHLDTIGVIAILPSDEVLSLDVAQFLALGGMQIDSNTAATLADTGSAIAGLDTSQLGALAGAGIDTIDVTDTVLNLTAAQEKAIAGGVALTAGDTVSIVDTGANIATITASQFAALSGIDHIDATNNVLSLSVAQYLAIPAGVLDSGDVVTLVDTGAHIAALSPTDFGALAANGIDKIDASTPFLTLTVAQYQALSPTAVALTGGDFITIKDTGANLAGMSEADFLGLATHNIDLLDASDNVLTINAQRFTNLGTVGLNTPDFVTLLDLGSNLAALNLTSLAGKHVDALDASDNLLTLFVQDVLGLGAVTLASGDTVTVADTEANLEALTVPQIDTLGSKHVDILDSDTDVLLLTAPQVAALISNGIVLDATDAATLADSGANIAGLSAAQIGALDDINVKTIDASSALSLKVDQYQALGTVTLTALDDVTIADTGANLANLDFSGLAASNVDVLDATNGILSLTVGQYQAIKGLVSLTLGDTVTLLDSSDQLEGLSALQIGDLAGDGIDAIDATDNHLALTYAQINALNGVTLAADDTVTLADSEANIEALLAGTFTTLGGLGVDVIHATDVTPALTLDAARIFEIITAGMIFNTLDTVTLLDTGTTIAALTAGQIGELAGANVDRIDASDNVLSLTAAQYLALGTVVLTGGDDVTLADTGVNIAALSAAQIAALGAKGFDQIDALSGDAVSLTVAQYQALGSVALTLTDIGTLADIGGTLATLTPVQIAALAGKDIDVINATNNVLSLTVAQYLALGVVNLTGGDTIILRDTGAHIAGLSPVALAALSGKGIDQLDATDNRIVFSLAQAHTIQSSQLAVSDTIVINGTAAGETINGFAFNDVIAAAAGNDTLNGRGGNDVLFGGSGHDLLSGGPGNDRFYFATAPVPANADRITDFSPAQDTIILENAVFTAAGARGMLATASFHVGPAAHDGNDRIIYNGNTGALFYDRDGTGAAAKHLIAILDQHLALTHADFLVV